MCRQPKVYMYVSCLLEQEASFHSYVTHQPARFRLKAIRYQRQPITNHIQKSVFFHGSSWVYILFFILKPLKKKWMEHAFFSHSLINWSCHLTLPGPGKIWRHLNCTWAYNYPLIKRMTVTVDGELLLLGGITKRARVLKGDSNPSTALHQLDLNLALFSFFVSLFIWRHLVVYCTYQIH